ncbi:MAG: YgiW/YdeI family stress tolerance OB fold protein [Termitinemataceae bacterium]|nr:MAG: YgiW/YdeI family stress tolerance OB fold protein [Termitinemataceae bacterium]
MKRRVLFFGIYFGLVFLMPTIGIYAKGGFTGPGDNSGARGQGQLVTALAAKDLPDDTKVILQGTIVQSLGDEKYTFRDSSGEIVVDIDRKVWRGLSVGTNDRVEIYGEVDVGRKGIKIEVKTIRKI